MNFGPASSFCLPICLLTNNHSETSITQQGWRESGRSRFCFGWAVYNFLVTLLALPWLGLACLLLPLPAIVDFSFCAYAVVVFVFGNYSWPSYAYSRLLLPACSLLLWLGHKFVFGCGCCQLKCVVHQLRPVAEAGQLLLLSPCPPVSL